MVLEVAVSAQLKFNVEWIPLVVGWIKVKFDGAMAATSRSRSKGDIA